VTDGKIERKKIKMKFSLFSLPFSILFLLVLGGAALAWCRCSYHLLEIITLVPWPIQH